MTARDAAHGYDVDTYLAQAIRSGGRWDVGLILMGLVVLSFLALALVTGQQRQAETCAKYAGTPTPCGSGLVQP